MQERFGGIHHQKVKLLGLIPSIAVSYKCASIEEVGQLYTTDLPSPHMLNTEYRRWKAKWNSVPVKKRPDFLQGALQQCDKDTFPNIHTLLLIACTLPVTVCENERANSQLKLLKTYLQSTMSEERLSALAMMKVHRTSAKRLSLDSLVVAFTNKNNRRMLLPCMFSE